MLQKIFLISFFGALGALLRYAVVSFLSPASFPWGVLLVNSIGCFVVGLAFSPVWGAPSENFQLAMSVGFLGALTTFSAFGQETVLLFEKGSMGLAFLNIAANLLIGFGALFLGRGLARVLV